MIHFDFDDRYQDELVVGSAISTREGILLSTVFHVLIMAVIMFGPEWTFLKPDPEELEARQQELLRQQREQEAARQRFVFVQPRVEIEAKTPPERAELSDIDRRAQAVQRAERPTNPMPFSRGDSSERTETVEERRTPSPETEVAESPPASPAPPQPQAPPEQRVARALPPAQTGFRREPEISDSVPPVLRRSLRNLDQYVRNQTFNNPQGGANDPGSSIQFDTRGIEFGPWIRRFVARVKRNWLIPQAAMVDRGHVVLQFTIHRNGRITDLRIVQPSHNGAFNRAAFNAIENSNPLEPLPPDYPDDVISPFTVTFYYNEQPPI